ncbi:hypothetical protein AQUCO_00200817v1 [Aquilegia coerulea]|uniref:Uncharacterized protein n=1 Tax=Aquilegia coerulea TaxID=218851 RepID=A0A2G5F4U4_AQUCA|nr:hypothetical protein AQUCO_00200817v1 [Aquilegia coerulea]
MQTPNSSSQSSESREVEQLRNLNLNLHYSSPSPSPSPSSRLWRPQAQRNLRKQWMKLVSHRQKWVSASSNCRSHATSLVNAYLSERYMPSMDLGVLKDMPNIRQKACLKLARQQELYGKNLLSSYKDMVGVVSHMVNDSRSMRCFMKAGSPLAQFSSYSEDKNDLGDGGCIPVFAFWSLPYHEKLAEELVQMFSSELILKRLLVLELLSMSCEEQQTDTLSWSDEIYSGEHEYLISCGLYDEKTCQPIPPQINGQGGSDSPFTVESNIRKDQEVLQVYLTTWFVEVNIDTHRVEDIFSIVGEEMHIVGEEMHVTLS